MQAIYEPPWPSASWWANVALAVCLAGTFVFMPYDLFLVPFSARRTCGSA
jgi:hypothetical protein